MTATMNPQVLDVGNGCKCYFDDESERYIVFPAADPTRVVAEVENMQAAVDAAAAFVH